MAKKKTSATPAACAPRKELVASQMLGESQGHAVGRALASPAQAAARVMHAAEAPNGLQRQIDLPDLVDVLREHVRAVQTGDLSGIEAMLVGQANALQSLFVRLAERAMTCDSIPAFEVSMRMALRAQNQARATAETLATVKNPPVVFARQANIANGPQQVNNSTTLLARGENEVVPNEVLGRVEHGGMDTRATCPAIGSDTALEAVGPRHRSAN